ncbi:hypothetical protein LCGC14_1177660 [marine sediment metagenome]|uniref:Uncharacterized protein n=1 Tax=marine sediment metagenome TaxID=412755 RepID=A0A0F9LN33_9ZZZZ
MSIKSKNKTEIYALFKGKEFQLFIYKFKKSGTEPYNQNKYNT